ncbi:hypothetical protein DL98DRAFT_515093 [Cadophora sp. DSE1049]|nr:hypothetical protein DL98DRAFT_515093 [Cadophora sp. DSE1049]
MWPHHRQFPEDNFFFWQLKLQDWLYDKKFTFIVMVLDEGDAGPDSKEDVIVDKIISYAIWKRDGRSKAAKAIWAKKNTTLNTIDCWTTNVEIWAVGRKYVRRDAGFSRLEALGEAVEAIEKKYYSDIPEKWLLELIVTDVKFRRRGAATALIKWGTAEADREGICCRVEASPMGKPVYASCGFVELQPWGVQVPGQKEEFHMWAMFRKARTASHSDKDNAIETFS